MVRLWALNSAVECHLHTVEVTGSSPVAPTNLDPSKPRKVHKALRGLFFLDTDGFTPGIRANSDPISDITMLNALGRLGYFKDHDVYPRIQGYGFHKIGQYRIAAHAIRIPDRIASFEIAICDIKGIRCGSRDLI